MAIVTFPVKLNEIKTLTPNVKHFCFTRQDGIVLDFIPGQFISIHFPGAEKDVRRSYSIATIPTQEKNIEFAASYVKDGFASERLFNLKPGDTLTMSGPYGRLILRDEETPKRLWLVATGTGVTPYRSMLPLLSEKLKNTALQVILLVGVQYRYDSLYIDEFLDFAKQHPNFMLRAYYSRDDLVDQQHYEYKGYVQDAFSDLNPVKGEDVFYLCGNPNMIDDAYTWLKDQKHFEAQDVRREKYVS